MATKELEAQNKTLMKCCYNISVIENDIYVIKNKIDKGVSMNCDIGSVVTLNSGGQAMTVIKRIDGCMLCAWFENGLYIERKFPSECLKCAMIIPKQEKPDSDKIS
jgi:uncharacterized protein YodC (DUF2158 family)